MMLKWDHLIHYIKNLESFEFPDQFLSVVAGGRHDKLGTYNKLSYFDLSYIEFIDVFDQSLVEKSAGDSNERLSFAATLKHTGYSEGFKRLCFRTDDIETLKDHFISCGRQVIGPNRMSRTKPDGEVISWQLLYIDDNSDRELPFFIQWNESDEDRKEALAPLFQQLTVKEIVLVTKDPAKLIAEWQDLLGAIFENGVLYIPESPAFTVTHGDSDGILSVTIQSHIEGTMTVRNGIYKFVQ
ncbi:VOC family protein [Macrococcus lamae]|uniref:VOC family protein n=1 Tax=Macrococcus lamae TaxID=198484 RepID=A0A4R6BWK6_9STAP|nr:VOC family protein [Macrococcus lamae]TDM12826.1 VOC family protein [Macrococcus lamae]